MGNLRSFVPGILICLASVFHAYGQALPTLAMDRNSGLKLSGSPGVQVTIYYTTNLSEPWRQLKTFYMPDWHCLLDGTAPLTIGNGFYRVQPPPSNPNPARLIWIPSGRFLMGSRSDDPSSEINERPQTGVILDRGFFMSKYLVTQEEYLAIIGSNPSYFTGDPILPVEQVGWADATNYCAQLTQREQQLGRLQTGWTYRLPTEAEWEYACRAGTVTRYSFGDAWIIDDQAVRRPDYATIGLYAWTEMNSSGRTHPVGEKLPNPWGLYDMHGNVMQWCLDWYRFYPGGTIYDPIGSQPGLARGGDWNEDAYFSRSANRGPGSGGLHSRGFRVVLAQEP